MIWKLYWKNKIKDLCLFVERDTFCCVPNLMQIYEGFINFKEDGQLLDLIVHFNDQAL